MATVAIEKLRKVYQHGSVQLRVLRDMKLSIEQGDYFEILGPSGPGKSTLEVSSVFSEYLRNFCSDGWQRGKRFKAGGLSSNH